MHLVILNGSPRSHDGNTGLLINAFLSGFQQNADTASVFAVSKQDEVKQAFKAIEEVQHILVAFPVFGETLPSILLAFFEQLQPIADGKKRTMAFLVHSGFFERCQRRCSEALVKTLCEKRGFAFGGILSIGLSFGLSFMDADALHQYLQPVRQCGQFFAAYGHLNDDFVEQISGPDYVDEASAKVMNRMIKFYLYDYAEKLGTTEDLFASPYQKEL